MPSWGLAGSLILAPPTFPVPLSSSNPSSLQVCSALRPSAPLLSGLYPRVSLFSYNLTAASSTFSPSPGICCLANLLSRSSPSKVAGGPTAWEPFQGFSFSPLTGAHNTVAVYQTSFPTAVHSQQSCLILTVKTESICKDSTSPSCLVFPPSNPPPPILEVGTPHLPQLTLPPALSLSAQTCHLNAQLL